MRKRTDLTRGLMLTLCFGCVSVAWGRDAARDIGSDPLFKVMEQELQRAKGGLAKADPAPYFLNYSVYDQQVIAVAASLGSILTSVATHQRQGVVMMRVGDAALDNTHKENLSSAVTSGFLPLDDNAGATAGVLWQLTSREYRKASPAFLKVKAETTVRAEEEDKSPAQAYAIAIDYARRQGYKVPIRRIRGKNRPMRRR